VSNTVTTTYLNDHLAGSVMALELLDDLIGRYQGEDRELLVQLRREVREDQQVVQQLVRDLGGKESSVRKAAAWITEKLSRAKLRMDDAGSGELRMLEAFEALALGIQGKLSLWRGLAEVAEGNPRLKAMDLDRLQARASDQFDLAERFRLAAARRALAS
jgi:hypothetical protein